MFPPIGRLPGVALFPAFLSGKFVFPQETPPATFCQRKPSTADKICKATKV
jgi:hypothetical protein